jgi:hypothetical protein
VQMLPALPLAQCTRENTASASARVQEAVHEVLPVALETEAGGH